MAKVSFSISPGPEGGAYANITAEGEPSEVEAMIQAVDKLQQKYPALKPKEQTKSVFPTDR